VGLLYFNGGLEASSDVRSIPLGAKRKPGRPKKLPNCLTRSPVQTNSTPGDTLDEVPVQDDEPGTVDVAANVNNLEADIDHDVLAAPIRKTTRKRKRVEVEPESVQSPVSAILDQSRAVQAGLGASKPTKKSKRLPGNGSNQTNSSNLPDPPQPKLPPQVGCKKRKGSCNHEVVFSKHYDKTLWAKYAEHVRSKKSSVDIDPNYLV
jgi:hypothetical protein